MSLNSVKKIRENSNGRPTLRAFVDLWALDERGLSCLWEGGGVSPCHPKYHILHQPIEILFCRGMKHTTHLACLCGISIWEVPPLWTDRHGISHVQKVMMLIWRVHYELCEHILEWLRVSRNAHRIKTLTGKAIEIPKRHRLSFRFRFLSLWTDLLDFSP